MFYVKYGAICKSGEITKALKALEKDGRIAVNRNPAFSPKTNKPTTFMTESRNQTVSVKWVK